MFVDGSNTTYACNGADGSNGAQGPIGPQGIAGPIGPQGVAGVSVVASTLAPGNSNCPQGGSMFVDGSTITYACNGANGANGAQGIQGPPGPQGMLGPMGAQGPTGPIGAPGVSVVATALSPGDPNCPFGGTRFVDGSTITYACTGATGAQGPQGVQGVQGAQGPQGATGPTGPSSITTCPSPYTTYHTGHSTLCIYRDVFTADWSDADTSCMATYGGKLCDLEQVHRACASGYSLTTSTWLANRDAQFIALYVASTNCNGFENEELGEDGTRFSPTMAAAYCCLEYMSYP
jgi:hypothetical protein